MSAPVEVPEDVTAAMADVMNHQARVSRAEAALTAARGRLGAALVRLTRVARDHGVELPPLAAALVHHNEGLVSAGAEGVSEQRPERSVERSPTLRARVQAVLEASPGEVLTPARVARTLGSRNRDSIRNTLLFLAARGQIEKIGEGQYQARRKDGAT